MNKVDDDDEDGDDVKAIGSLTVRVSCRFYSPVLLARETERGLLFTVARAAKLEQLHTTINPGHYDIYV